MPPEKPEIPIGKTPPEQPKAERKLHQRKFNFDRAALAEYITKTHQQDLDDRQERTLKRMERRAKLMGWLPNKDWPWPNSANFWVATMLIAKLKTEGTLQNALKSIRPMMKAKANQRVNKAKEEKITRILDYQFFVENRGDKIIDGGVSNFTSDEAVYLFTQWVKETQTIHDVRVLQGVDESAGIAEQMLANLQILFRGEMIAQRMTDDDGWDWEVTLKDGGDVRIASVKFYDTADQKIEACIVKPATTHDGPVIRVLDFEDVTFPVRSENLQPPSPSNPNGAPYFDVRFTVNLDTIKRRMEDKTYDLMTEDDWKAIQQSKSGAGSGDDQDLEKQQKDELEGTTVSEMEREDRELLLRFGRHDVNGDGLEEDVIIHFFKDSKIVAKVVLLTEAYPGLPIRRPISDESFIPTTNRVLGMSQDELLEALQDMNQVLMNQHIDWGTLTNTPFFTYRNSSGLKDEKIIIEPATGIGLDDPNDLVFPQMPQKDSTYALNTMTLLQQFVQDLRGFSDMSASGRVPAGKASALRNVGTVGALLGQADVRSEQILRRLFACFKYTYLMMHRLNRRYLPDKKEVRIMGQAEAGQEAYIEIDRSDLEADVDFEFDATLLNTNKELLSQAINEALALVVTPLALQMGIVTPQQVYNLFRDKLKAVDLDPDTYLTKPPEMMPGPKLLAEEVLSLIIANRVPEGGPAEQPQEHLMKLNKFMEDPLKMGLLNPAQSAILGNWIAKVEMAMMQQQMMMQAAAQFAGKQGGPGGEAPQSMPNETGAAANPSVGPGGQLLDESMSGEMQQ